MITGTSSGLGAALAERVHRELGAEVLRVDRHPPRVGPGQRVVEADLATNAGMEVAREALREWRPQVLVNNAAVMHGAPLVDTPDARVEEILRVGYHTPVELMNEMARLSRERDEDTWVVNIVSPYRQIGVRNQSLYCVAKIGLSRAGESVAIESSPEQRLTVVSVSPGVFDTPMRPSQSTDAWLVRTFKTRVARTPEEFARVVLARLGRGTVRPHWTMRLGWDGPAFEATVRVFSSDWFVVALDRLIGNPPAPPHLISPPAPSERKAVSTDGESAVEPSR